MAQAKAYDVIVVGSGAGGGTIAHRLTHEGLSVLLIEEGRWLDGGSRSRYIRHVHPDRTQPIACVGGQTKFYGAALYRLREADFEAVAHEAGVSPAWPVLYDDLEPYYDQAERLYRVHGAAQSDPTEPPHARAYPYAAIAAHPRIGGLVEQLVATGLHPAPIPRALDRRDGAGACRMCPACDAHQCGFDAKMDAETAAIRPALATGRLKVADGTHCLKVLTDPAGRRARGVRVECDGVEEEISAGTVVVAGGVPRSATLLRR
ncbi:GMC family oxidoreductase N-terminal domain-containing protein, partial [uncultured Sphingomonas sp.]|uniref:GMC family oxidoreductase N-terminal domain-containing protein n=1 Tax=uncultured Sphingomonas sp. TaxID=158754 RepID=UPI002607E577